jgi:hypothetical protein
MSGIQALGIGIVRVLAIMVVIPVAVIIMVTAYTTIAFAMSLPSQWGVSLLMAVIVLVLEGAKAGLPVIIHNERLDAPRLAEWHLVFFVALAAISFALSMGWAMSGNPSKEAAVALFFAQIISAGGPYSLVNAFKWMNELQSDGVQPAPQMVYPAGMYPEQIAGPMPGAQPFQQPGPVAMTLVGAFSAWVSEQVDIAPDGVLDLGQGFAAFNNWAAARSYPTATEAEFAPLMAKLAQQSGGYLGQGQAFGIALAPDSSQYFQVG